MSKENETIRVLKQSHNMDPADINSEIHAPDAPIIAEVQLAVTVLELCKAGQFDLAAKEIEIAVRLAFEVEAAA